MSQSSPRSSSESSLDRTGPEADRVRSGDAVSDRSASWPTFDPMEWLRGRRFNLHPGQEEMLRRVYGLPAAERERDAPSDREEALRCREQALLSASYMAPELTPFVEEDAENVVILAKRFERYLRDGE